MKNLTKTIIILTSAMLPLQSFAFTDQESQLFSAFSLETSVATSHLRDRDGKYKDDDGIYHDLNENNNLVGITFNMKDDKRVSYSVSHFENSYWESSWSAGMGLQMVDNAIISGGMEAGLIYGYDRDDAILPISDKVSAYISPYININILSISDTEFYWGSAVGKKSRFHLVSITNRMLGGAYVAGIRYKYVY